MDQPNFFGDYDTLLELVRNRVSVRKLKPDPIPDEYVEKILEIGRWAMSGANGQPWEFVVVKDPKIKQELFRVYIEENTDFIYWMEQQRDFKLRHPAYQMTAEESVEKQRKGEGWSRAPVLIVILGDGRRQWATVQGAPPVGPGAAPSPRRPPQHRHDDASRGGIPRARQPAHDHSYRGPVQARAWRPRPPHLQPDHADRISRRAGKAGRAPPARGHGALRYLRHVEIHDA